MQSETTGQGSILKGILFSIIGAVVGVLIWLGVIWIFRGGTGGFIGGGFSAITGMLIGGGYKLGAKRAGFLGVIIGLILAVVAVFIAIYQGVAISLYREGLVESLYYARYMRSDHMTNNPAFASVVTRELFIAGIITIVMTMMSLRSDKSDKKADTTNEG